LIFGGVADESRGFTGGSEGDITGSDAITQFVGTDFYARVAPDSYA
jgi:hypothetical protein